MLLGLFAAYACTCPHGTKTNAVAANAELRCEIDGNEDCSACDAGYKLNHPAGTAEQKCVVPPTPAAASPALRAGLSALLLLAAAGGVV